ncbi:MAG: Ni/Fe hydrogenase subunit alpha [Anaerolineaceae bacterium]|nr:Ni/Fe hydrogenase subunit alpha [Anaerolineaceae bacterium]
MKTKISVDPITRLEGHGRIDLFLNDDGSLENAYMIVPELRGFEKFCENRPVEEMPRITQRICGVCPVAHHLAAAKAGDAVYHVDPPIAAKKIRELMNSAFFVADHATHFYVLGGPDFIVGPDAPKNERNILGVVRKVGREVGARVMGLLKDNHEIVAIIGGRYIHSVSAIIGGVSKSLTKEDQARIIELAKKSVETAKFTLELFNKIVLENQVYLELILSDAFFHRTYYMGMVDDNNKINFYDGKVRVVGPDGKELLKFGPNEYLDVIAEHIEPWTYLKFPYLKKIGWKGFVDGPESGVYRASPLGRLNVSEGMTTPFAQAEYERFFDTLGGKPVHSTLATHWARLVELLYAAERTLELANDPDITSDHFRTIPTETPTEGVSLTEAPRGTLIHHYVTDERGLLKSVNLIVGTTNNYAAIDMSIKKAAQNLIVAGQPITDGILNKIEMAFRTYDPCLGCATHAITGESPLLVKVFDHNRNLVQEIRRD